MICIELPEIHTLVWLLRKRKLLWVCIGQNTEKWLPRVMLKN